WPEMFRLIEELRPAWVVGENVAGHVSLGLDDVLSDLENAGYQARAFVIPAAAVGAPHRRDRVFVVAHASRQLPHRGGAIREGRRDEHPDSSQDVADTESKQNWRLQQPRVPANIGTNGENVADANDQRRKEFYVATSGE